MTDRCATCGESVVADEWHPVATERDDEGNVEIHDFCSQDCRNEWQDGD